MNKHVNDTGKITGFRRGSLLVLVMVMLCFFGILAGMQALLHASAGLSSRALDLRRQRLALVLRAEHALSEALLGLQESEAGAGLVNPRDAVEMRLAELGGNDGLVRLDRSPALVSLQPLLPGPSSLPLLEPGSGLLAAANPELRDCLEGRVAESPAGVFGFRCRQSLPSGPSEFSFSREAVWVGVPLSNQALCAYDMPDEIGQTLELASLSSGLKLMGLVSSRDAAACPELGVRKAAQLYHFRHRASTALAYQRLFSQASVDMLSAAAGPAHMLDLGRTAGDSPRMEGLGRRGDGVSLDIGLAGTCEWGGLSEEGNVFVVFSSAPDRILRLTDSTGASGRPPLVVLAVGTAAQPLDLELDGIARPLLLVALSCRVRIKEGATLCSALFLSPGCTLSAPAASVAHLSVHAGIAGLDVAGLDSGVDMPASLEALCPRVQHVSLQRRQP
jgi:hypothetical protein